MTGRGRQSMAITFVFGAAALASVPSFAQRTAARCARAADTVATSWLVLEPASGRGDVTAWVCLRPPAGGSAVGSYHGELTWDPSVARAVDATSPAGGSRVVNRSERGRVRFAGASPAGFAPGEMLRVRLRALRRGAAVRMVLRWREVNAADGRSLAASLRVDSVAPVSRRCSGDELKLVTLTPDTVELSSGDRRAVAATGCGFAARNIVEVGPATVRDVPSTDGGTRLAFVVPLTLDAAGEVPPMAMPLGVVRVRVIAPRRASNTLPLFLR